MGTPGLALVVLGGLVGLISSAWRGLPAMVGWLGIAMICGGVLPSIASEFNMRFLHPMILVLPLLWLTPIAALTARRRGLWRYLPLATLPVMALPGSPWTEWNIGGELLTRVAGSDTMGVVVYQHLRESFPDIVLEVTVPGSIALVALDGREGTFYANDRRFVDTEGAIALDPNRHVLQMAGRSSGQGPEIGQLTFTGLDGRDVVATWPIPSDPVGVDRNDSAGAGLSVELLGPRR